MLKIRVLDVISVLHHDAYHHTTQAWIFLLRKAYGAIMLRHMTRSVEKRRFVRPATTDLRAFTIKRGQWPPPPYIRQQVTPRGSQSSDKPCRIKALFINQVG